MSEVIRIRGGRLGDEQGIARVHVDSWQTTYAGILPDEELLKLSVPNRTRMWGQALRRKGLLLVADDEKSGIIGFASAGRNRHQESPFTSEVYALYLLSDFQGFGIGRALLSAIFRELNRGGHESSMLWVLSQNPTRFFYEAMGGRRFAEGTEMVAGEAFDTIGYCWDDLNLFA